MTRTRRPEIPLHDRVLIRPIPPAEQTKSGLHLPPSASSAEVPAVGTVLAVGAGRTTDYGLTITVPALVKPGAVVRYAKHAGVPAGTEEEPSLVLVRAGDVLSVLWGEEAGR